MFVRRHQRIFQYIVSLLLCVSNLRVMHSFSSHMQRNTAVTLQATARSGMRRRVTCSPLVLALRKILSRGASPVSVSMADTFISAYHTSHTSTSAHNGSSSSSSNNLCRSKRVISSSQKHTPRVFVPGDIIVGASVSISKDTAHYLSTVMRLKPGNNLRVFNDKQQEFLCTVVETLGTRRQAASSVNIEAVEQLSVKSDTPLPCVLFFSPLKKHRLKILFEKATELGLKHLVPVNMKRTNFPMERKYDAFRQILVQSAAQSERLSIPTLHRPISLSEVKSLLLQNEHCDASSSSGSSSDESKVDTHGISTIGSENIGNSGIDSALPTYITHLFVCQERLDEVQSSSSSSSSSSSYPSSSSSFSPLPASSLSLFSALQNSVHHRPGEYFGLLIGPEGGIAADEIEMLEHISTGTVDSTGTRNRAPSRCGDGEDDEEGESLAVNKTETDQCTDTITTSRSSSSVKDSSTSSRNISNSVSFVSLGRNILRAETAAIAALVTVSVSVSTAQPFTLPSS